jgi:hypothetical protein
LHRPFKQPLLYLIQLDVYALFLFHALIIHAVVTILAVSKRHFIKIDGRVIEHALK